MVSVGGVGGANEQSHTLNSNEHYRCNNWLIYCVCVLSTFKKKITFKVKVIQLFLGCWTFTAQFFLLKLRTTAFGVKDKWLIENSAPHF